MVDAINNTDAEPIGVTFTELRGILAEREKQWQRVMKKLILDRSDLETEVLTLQQQLGIPLKLPAPRKYDNQ